MRKLIFILLILPFCIAADWAGSDCLENFNKIVGFYKNSVSNKSYTKFSFYSEEGGERSQEVISEIWQDGVKYKMENPMMAAFQDMKTVIIISKSKKVISIYPNINGANSSAKEEMIKNNLMKEFTKDSVAKYFKNMTCSEVGNNGELRVDIQNDYAENLGYTSMIYKYDKKTKQIKENILESQGEEGPIRTYYKYLAMSSNFPETILTSNVLNQIYAGSSLKPNYNGYKVLDYRSKEKKQ